MSKLPPLPHPYHAAIADQRPALFTQDQLDAYAQKAVDEAVAAENEACAKLCEAVAMANWINFKSGSGASYSEGASDASDECAQAIRARKEAHHG